MGGAIVPVFFACGDLASGKLVIPLEATTPEQGSWYLVHEADLLTNSRAMSFTNWITRELEADSLLQKYRSNRN